LLMPAARPTVWPDVFFFQNYRASAWSHLWSLAIEEHFYILLPLVVLLLARRRRMDLVPAICGAVMAACLALRVTRWAMGAPLTFLGAFAPTHLRMDSLAFGVLLAWTAQFRPELVTRFTSHRAAWAAGPLFLVPAVFVDHAHPFVYTVGFCFLYLGYGALLLCSLHRIGTSAPVRMLGRVGEYSYSIYLFHTPLQYLLMTTVAPALPLPVFAAASLAVGIVMAKLVERPALALRDALVPRKAGA